jgi:endonuclease/exonuclease/phosphatase family metal-dependent hydrolase
MFSEFKAHSKSVDQNDPCPPLQRSRGHGGTAILYRKELVNSIEECPDGSERITVVHVKSVPPVCIISAYFPCRGLYSIQDYSETLDQLTEIIQKYSPTSVVVIAGDYNASLLEERSDNQSRQLRAFIKEMGLTMPNLGNKPTFHSHNGRDTSQIDYILTTRGQHLSQVTIADMEPTNTSTHVPITALVSNITIEKSPKSQRPVFPPRPIWSKCNPDTFQAYVASHLNISSPPATTDALDSAINHITEVLTKATEETDRKSVV